MKDLPKKPSFPSMEEEILEFWNEQKIFTKWVRRNEGKKEFVFYEGPPTANGMPHIGHVMPRAVKDLIPRYKQMQGFHVYHRDGWDCQGLPVELEVEKKMGFKGKEDIEKYGVAEFNKLCRKSVTEYADEWEIFSKRIGYWSDTKHAYKTMDSEYIESLWWVMKQLWDKNLFYKGHKVMPYCSRCGTTLSSHELSQGYKDVVEVSVYVEFKLVDDPKTSLLAWTTTPWTLPSNIALAVNPDEDYVVVSGSIAGNKYILAEKLAEKVFSEDKKNNELVILLDIDEVINKSRNTLQALKEIHGINPEQILPFFENYLPKCSVGSADLVEELSKFLPSTDWNGTTDEFLKLWFEADNQLDREAIKSVKELRQAGYKIYACTDQEKYRLEYLKKEMGLKNVFDGFFVSCEIGHTKKESEFFSKALSSLKANPNKILYIDDRQKNLDSAKTFGINTMLFDMKEGGFPEKISEQIRKIESISGKSYEVIKTIKGSELVGKKYTPLFPYGEKEEGKVYHEVVDADFVSMKDGTGIVHTAVAYGAEDHALGQKKNLGMFHFVNEEGKFVDEVTDFAGMWVKDADKEIIKYLKNNDLLFKRKDIKHSYPHCWRCKTPLLYYPIEAWFIATTKMKDKIIKNNEKVNWVPDHYKKGRMGNWLETMVDWNLSRSRYWGTPLPIWVSDDGEEMICIESFRELKERAVNPDLIGDEFDPHRPFIDDIKLKSEKGKGELTRVPYVADCWFDSGAMPFAQNHWPFKNKGFYPFPDAKKSMESILSKSESNLPPEFPADFISEAVDQTRGWFYTLLVLSALLYDKPAFKNVVVSQHGLDEKGKKQSKSIGNVLDPNVAIREAGADSLRWMIFVNDVTKPMRMSVRIVKESTKNFLIPLWNSVTFFKTYAEIDNFTPSNFENFKPENELDKWILSKTNSLIEKVVENLDKYEVAKAAQELEGFLDDLNNWYIRNSRKRFWKSGNDQEKVEAFETLWRVLIDLTKMSAPFIPFTSEKIYQVLKTERMPESVHLCDYPTPEKKRINKGLENKVNLNKDVVYYGLSARAKGNMKLRQPLGKAKVWLVKELFEKVDPEIIKDELNVKELELTDDINQVCGGFSVKLDAQKLGPIFGAGFKMLMDLVRNGEYFVDLEEEKIYVGGGLKTETVKFLAQRHSVYTIGFGDVMLDFDPNDKSEVSGNFKKKFAVSIDTEITEDLEKEGLARELVRRIQTLRKATGLEVSDRIKVFFATKSDLLKSTIESNMDYIKAEVLAIELTGQPKVENGESYKVGSGEILIRVVKNIEEQKLI